MLTIGLLRAGCQKGTGSIILIFTACNFGSIDSAHHLSILLGLVAELSAGRLGSCTWPTHQTTGFILDHWWTGKG